MCSSDLPNVDEAVHVGIVSWSWTGPTGAVQATTPTWTKQFTSAKSVAFTLKVTDGPGLSNSVTQTVVVP